MNKFSIIAGIISVIGFGYMAKNISNKIKNETSNEDNFEASYLVPTSNVVDSRETSNNRNEIKNMVTKIYKNIVETGYGSSTLNSWINKLASKQTTLYNFLLSVISPKINTLNVTNLVKSLYLGILDRNPTANESSKLITVFNDELRKYASKDRALRKMLTYFVKTSVITRYCNLLNMNSI